MISKLSGHKKSSINATSRACILWVLWR